MSTYKLQSPVTVADVMYTELPLRRAKAKDLAASDLVKGEARKGFAVLASLTGVPLAVIEELDIDDFTALSEAAAPFLGSHVSSKEEAP